MFRLPLYAAPVKKLDCELVSIESSNEERTWYLQGPLGLEWPADTFDPLGVFLVELFERLSHSSTLTGTGNNTSNIPMLRCEI